MGENVKRLALIDAEKFNSLMKLLQNNTARQKLLDDTTRTPEEAGLIESHNTVLKNKSSLAGTDVINYLKKKDNYRESLNLDASEGDPNSTAAQPAAGGSGQPAQMAYKFETMRIHLFSHDIQKLCEETLSSRNLNKLHNPSHV